MTREGQPSGRFRPANSVMPPPGGHTPAAGPPPRYQPHVLESVWRARWAKAGLFTAADPATADERRRKAYVLAMPPYPSGRIHLGHVRAYAIGDVMARFHRMRGRHVLHPLGWDAFGLPAELAAEERGRSPREWIRDNVATMRAQLSQLGLGYDPAREVLTCEPRHYHFGQLVFTRMMRAGLAYRRKAWVNWSVELGTVLADEQVVSGRCFRTGGPVERRALDQWFVRITAYSDELLDGLDALRGRWPESVLRMQRAWIGRREGVRVRMALASAPPGHAHVDVFVPADAARRLAGAAFVAIAPDHPLAASAEPLEGDARELRFRRIDATAVHPATAAVLPIYVVSTVDGQVGTGAVIGAPEADEFSQRIAEADGLTAPASSGPSDPESTLRALLGAGTASPMVTHRLRDWCVSRQRRWGAPIPVLYGADGAALPVPEDELPVLLPDERPTGANGSSPEPRDPRDRSRPARRETDTFDTFWDSSFYFVRHAAPDAPAGAPLSDAAAAWLPVDGYVGGVEHAVMHLLYARFFHKALIDLELLPRATPREPFARLVAQGRVRMQTHWVDGDDGRPRFLYPEQIGADGRPRVPGLEGKPVQTGRAEKMSKSKKNVVDPDGLVARWGADALRVFVLSVAPPEVDLVWSDRGIRGARRFLARVFRLAHAATAVPAFGLRDPVLDRAVDATVASVTIELEGRMHLPHAISALQALAHRLGPALTSPEPATRTSARVGIEVLVRLLSPFAPHLSDELFAVLGGDDFTLRGPWPEATAVPVPTTITVQIDGRTRARVVVPADADEATAVAAARALPSIAALLGGAEPRKVFYAPARAVNLVL